MLYGTTLTNKGIRAFADSILSGKMTVTQLIDIIEHSPRLAQALCDGLSVSGYGKVGPHELIRLAEHGHLNIGAISRAFTY